MTENSHILLAYDLGDGDTPLPLKGKAVSLELKNQGLAWVHLDANNPKTKNWLKKEISYLDQIIIDALLEDETRPRLVEFENGALIILRGVNFNHSSNPDDMVSIRVWVDSERIISLQKRQVRAVFEIEEEILIGKAPKNSGEFIANICKKLLHHLEPFLANLDELTGDIEEKVLETHDDELRESVINIRKQALMFRRHLAPQKEVIKHLCSCNQDWLNDIDRRNLEENFNNTMRYIEDLDEIKERSQIIHDELSNSINQKVNKNMYVLSVISAIFLPLTFLTGVLGMNVAGIPKADNPTAFYWVVAILFVVVGFQIIIFKRHKWF